MKHPNDWLSSYGTTNQVEPVYFMVSDGTDFFIDNSTFEFTSESVKSKELFLILIFPVIGLNFLILAVFRPWATQSLIFLFISLVIPFFMIMILFLTIYIPFNYRPIFGVTSWKLHKESDALITLTITKIKSQELSFTFKRDSFYPFQYFTSTIKEINNYSKLRNIFIKNKNVFIFTFSPETNSIEPKYYLFMNSLVENIQLIDTCIKKWINKDI